MGTERRVEPGRENKMKAIVPGPTRYQLPSLIQEGPRITLSPRIEDLGNKFIKIVPGPGAYTPGEKRKENYQYSFGLKPSVDYHSKYFSSIPGPGTYNQKAIRTFSTVGASLDKGEREKLLNKTQALIPGPGRYQPSTVDLISRNDAPKYGFGTSTRADIGGGPSKRSLSDRGGKGDTSLSNFKPLVPGPGAYEIKGVIGKDGPQRSLAGRFKIDLVAKELNYKPGPGQYTPQINFATKQSPNYKIGTSSREQYYLKDKFKYELPPPNIYNPAFEKVKNRSPATGLGYGERAAMARTFAVPGPGTY